ncbi:MAG: signal recognition particle-docking protein FtsY [Candidatus Omnitrophica bacterium]|nr:signal recognition particle-docking protein FtsY [Candidatus Omnitrophota bacterium]
MTEEKKGFFGKMLGGGKSDDSPATESEAAPVQKKGFFAKVRDRLTKTKSSLVSQTLSIFQRRGKIDEELLEEMEECLISADVGVNVSMHLVGEIRERAKTEKRAEGEDFDWLRKTFHDLILNEIGTETEGLKLEDSVNVILVVGVNGVGKTTTIGKIANRLRKEGRKVVVAAGDTFRAAAIDQLKIWADRSGSEIITGEDGSDPAAVVYNAIHKAKAMGEATVIVDTAGRLHNKANLMKELEKIGRIISREAEGAPQETLLVLDASTGQNGLTQAKVFKEIVPLTGIVLTKLDGTAKGGVTLSVRRELGLPVKFVGLGEGMEDLEPFDPKNFVDALFTEAKTEAE